MDYYKVMVVLILGIAAVTNFNLLLNYCTYSLPSSLGCWAVDFLKPSAFKGFSAKAHFNLMDSID